MNLTKSFKDIFRKNLQFLRKRGNFTQNELSLDCDFSRSYVGKIERGDVDPSLESIQRIAEVLDVNPVLLFLPLADPSSEESGFDDQDEEVIGTKKEDRSQSPSDESLEFLNNRVMSYYQHFEEFYEDAPFGDLLVTADGEILHANKTFQKYVNSEMPIHSMANLASYIVPSDRNALDSFLENVFSGSANQTMVVKFRRKPEGQFPAYVTHHRIESPEDGLLPDCEKSSEQSTCRGKECARLIVLDLSELTIDSYLESIN